MQGLSAEPGGRRQANKGIMEPKGGGQRAKASEARQVQGGLIEYAAAMGVARLVGVVVGAEVYVLR